MADYLMADPWRISEFWKQTLFGSFGAEYLKQQDQVLFGLVCSFFISALRSRLPPLARIEERRSWPGLSC